jgi:hypothetical protein
MRCLPNKNGVPAGYLASAFKTGVPKRLEIDYTLPHQGDPMKKWIILVSLFALPAFAQHVNVKDIDASQDKTIEIRNGTTNDQFQLTTSTEDIAGDAAPLLTDARTNWKKACADWKKETKDLNRENGNSTVLISCGKMECSTVAMESTCHSTGTNKISVRIR